MKDDKNDMNNMGICSDRIMTPLEVQRAAMNYKAVKQAAESDTSPGIVEWLLIGFGMVIILIATIQTILG